MFDRRIAFAAIAAGAMGVPYLASETEFGRNASRSINGVFTASDGTSDTAITVEQEEGLSGQYTTTSSPTYGSHLHHETETLWQGQPGVHRPSPLSRLAGGPVSDIRDVLRFDITPDWVAQHFARVTTVLADMQLDGMRVPIVTGTTGNDIAGTLTYYFDSRSQLQRVVLRGFTGDPQRLGTLLQQHYHMAAQPSLDASVMVTRWNGRPVNVLKVTRAPIMFADDAHQRYTVYLELNQPSLSYGISAESQRIIASDHATGRW